MSAATAEDRESAARLAPWRPVYLVRAGEISKIAPGGAWVKQANGTASFRHYRAGMREAEKGDYWLVLPDGTECTMARQSFLDLYAPSV